MVTKKMRLSAAAVVFAMLMTSVSPATAMAAPNNKKGEKLVVTKDHLDKDNALVLEDGDWGEIVFPRDVNAKKIQLKNVTVDSIQIESGTECTFEISGGLAGEVQISKPNVKKPTLRDKAKLIVSGISKQDAEIVYQQQKKEHKEIEKKAPNVVLKENASIQVIQASGNASLALKEGKVAQLDINMKEAETDLKLQVDGFHGKLVINQETEQGKGQGTIQLQLDNSKPTKAEIKGSGNGSLVLEGTNSVIEEAVVEGSTKLVLNVETKKLETAKDSVGVVLVILAKVVEAILNGLDSNITVTEQAVVENAVVNGEGAKVEGTGKLESVEVNNESADIKTEGTQIYDKENPKPTVTPTPTEAPSTDWWPTATPKPTEAPVTPDEPTVSPKPDEPTVSPKPDEPTVSPKPDEPTVSPKPDEPTVSPKPDEPTVSPKPDEPTVSPKPDEPTVSPEPDEPTVTPTPEPIYYTITVSVDEASGSATGGALGSASANVEKAVEGTEVTVTATANKGYEFAGWEVTGVEVEAEALKTTPLTFKMGTSNVTVKATFAEVKEEQPEPEPIYYTITVSTNDITGSASPGGTTGTATSGAFTVVVSNGEQTTEPATGGALTAKEGVSITVTATAVFGYQFVDWTVTGIDISGTTSTKLTFTMPASNVTITANFKKTEN